MTAGRDANALLNVGGTQHAIDLANDLEAGIFHHASSIAVAGSYEGHFTEDMFDEGQKLPSPYHRTKFESEKLVRTRVRRAPGACTARRSSSATRARARWTRSTARTTSSRRSRRRATRCRSGSRSSALEVGWTNIVPVDFVAAAIDHIAHEPDLDGQAFHLVNPRPQRAGDVLNTFARAGHAPQMAMRVDKRMTDMLPKGVLSYAMKLPALKDVRRTLLADLGIPDTVIEHMALVPRFDGRDTQRALAGSGIEVPALESYADEAVGLLGAQPRPRPVQGPLVRAARSTGGRC